MTAQCAHNLGPVVAEETSVKKLIVIGCGAAAALAASLVLIGEAGAAPDQSGQTFADAKAALTQAGFNPVVSTTVGDALPRDSCIVVRQQATTAAPFQGGGTKGVLGSANGNPRVLLSLNCNPQPK